MLCSRRAATAAPFTSAPSPQARPARQAGCCAVSRPHQQQPPSSTAPLAGQQQPGMGAVAAAVLAAAALLTTQPAFAEASAAAPSTSAAPVPTVYFGNGCFWGRQKDFVDTEKALGRTTPADISALVGYAGGQLKGPDGKVCYYYNGDPRTIYERLGHAEVVQVALSDEQASAQQEFKQFAQTYFSQFRQAPRGGGMMRQDPQDAGPGYRNVVGLPGGVASPYFNLLQEANVHGMELRAGQGNVYSNGAPTEGDELNVVWVVDSESLPFYRGEVYHQFHNGLGKAFPAAYTRDLKAAVAQTGKIAPTGCVELPF